MRILQLSGYFFPEKAASIYLEENRFEAFGAAGFHTVVHTPAPCRGITEAERCQYKKRRAELMYSGTLEVHRFPMYAEGRNPLLRALRYSLCWMIQFWKGLLTEDVDCIYLASTPPIQGMLGAFLKKFRKVPFVYNLQDIFPDSLAGTGLARKGGLLWKIGRLIEDFTYRHADRIIVISEDFKKNIMEKGVPEEKIAVVYNWVDQNAVVDVPRSENKLIGRYGLDPEKFYIEYSGNIGLTQNMDLLLDVMKELRTSHPGIGLILIGEGAYRKNVEDMVRREGLDNVTMLPFQDYADISHVFSLGDVGLVISKPGVGANSVPSKTWSIMSASRPVLASFDENELKHILTGNECGVFTAAGDRKAFRDAVVRLYEHPELCRKYGANGRRFIMENLTKEAGTRKYVDVIKSVTGQG